MNNNNWDYIIIGAGAAGCVVANRLSENPKNRVLLLEAGSKDQGLQFKIPVLQSKSVNNPRYDWQYQRESSDLPFGKTGHVWNAGKVLGGGTSINGLIYTRGAPEDYDSWRSSGNSGWGYEDVLPFFKKAETNTLLHPLSGRNGPMQVTSQKSPHILSEKIIEAAGECGIPHSNPLDKNGKPRAIYFQTNQKNGVRCSTSRAYLNPIKNRKNLKIITNAFVTKLIIKNKKAIGVEYQIENNQFIVYCKAEIIVSAGALSSPKILLCSGIGDADHLKEMGIKAEHHLPGVGKNLQEHTANIISVQTRIHSLNAEFSGLSILKNGLRWLLTKTGPAVTPVSQVGIYIKTSDAETSADIQIDFSPLGFMIDSQGIIVDKNATVMLAPILLKPKSRGKIQLQSPDALDMPKIIHSYFSDKDDLERLVMANQFVRRLLHTKAFSQYVDKEISPGIATQSMNHWREFIEKNAVRCFHPAGTCKMGDDENAVVDAQLRVYGIDGLRIADASIMPEIVSANTTATCIMIGEKAADLILKNKYP